MLINKRGIPVYVCINYNPGINFRTLSLDKIHHAVQNRIIIGNRLQMRDPENEPLSEKLQRQLWNFEDNLSAKAIIIRKTSQAWMHGLFILQPSNWFASPACTIFQNPCVFSNYSRRKSTCTSCYKCEKSLYTGGVLLPSCGSVHRLNLRKPWEFQVWTCCFGPHCRHYLNTNQQHLNTVISPPGKFTTNHLATTKSPHFLVSVL